MKKYLLSGISFLFSFALVAQTAGNDSLPEWKRERATISRQIDSLSIVATYHQNSAGYLYQQQKDIEYSIDTASKHGFLRYRENRTKVDNLNDRLALLSEIKNNVNSNFDELLIKLDSCWGIRNEIDQKIKAAGLKPRR
jgi:hypothetical protein